MTIRICIISFCKKTRTVRGQCKNNQHTFTAIAEKVQNGIVELTIQDSDIHTPPYRLSIPVKDNTQDLIVGRTYTHKAK